MEFIEKKLDGNLLVDTNENDDIEYNKQYLLIITIYLKINYQIYLSLEDHHVD